MRRLSRRLEEWRGGNALDGVGLRQSLSVAKTSLRQKGGTEDYLDLGIRSKVNAWAAEIGFQGRNPAEEGNCVTSSQYGV